MNFNLNTPAYEKVDKEDYDLLKRMLSEKPEERITASEALRHPYFNGFENNENEKLLNSPQLTSVTEKTINSRRIARVL